MNHFRFKTTCLLLLVFLLVGCVNLNTRKNEINRIVFATGGCYGTCPIQVIELTDSLTFRYHGVKHTSKLGYFTGSISASFWDSLNLMFEQVNYQQLDSSYQHSVDDLSTELFIYYGNKTKHIRGQEASLPDSVMNVYNWLMSNINQLNMQPSTDSLYFPTTIEAPLLWKTVRFIPPPYEAE